MTGTVYIYQAELHCEDCGEKLMRETPLPEGAVRGDETTYDSDEFPKGPLPLGPSDGPEHCGTCGVYLAAPLSDEGEQELLRQFAEVYHRQWDRPVAHYFAYREHIRALGLQEEARELCGPNVWL